MKKQIGTTDDFIKHSKQVHGDLYEYGTTVFCGRHRPVKITCKIHGEFTQSSANNHLNGAGCPVCGKERARSANRYTGEEFVTKAKTIHGDKYVYNPTDYVGSYTPMPITCPTHGVFKQLPKEHLRYGCIKCGHKSSAERRQLSTEQFITNAKAVHGDHYDYSKSVYTTSLTPVIIICPTHGEFKQKPNYHVNAKTGCPSCIQSHNERTISTILTNNNIEFIQEYAVKLPGRRQPLRYDFYLPNHNILIEYDGEQHFRPVKFNGITAERALKIHLNTKARDVLKTEYAAANALRLVRIPYTSALDIEAIIASFIRQTPV